jgi:hypothetical protein
MPIVCLVRIGFDFRFAFFFFFFFFVFFFFFFFFFSLPVTRMQRNAAAMESDQVCSATARCRSLKLTRTTANRSRISATTAAERADACVDNDAAIDDDADDDDDDAELDEWCDDACAPPPPPPPLPLPPLPLPPPPVIDECTGSVDDEFDETRRRSDGIER